MLKHRVDVCLVFKILTNCFPSDCAILYSQQWMRGSVASHPHWHWVLSVFLILAILWEYMLCHHGWFAFSWLLVKSSIFSYNFLPYRFHPYELCVCIFCLLFFSFFLMINYASWVLISVNLYALQMSSSWLACLDFVYSIFWWAEIVYFNTDKFINVFLYGFICFTIIITKENIPYL